jgi:hypothetical protein
MKTQKRKFINGKAAFFKAAQGLSVNNREKLPGVCKKSYSIISVLDKPTEPFIMVKYLPVIFPYRVLPAVLSPLTVLN